jgi:hypothetical protein
MNFHNRIPSPGNTVSVDFEYEKPVSSSDLNEIQSIQSSEDKIDIRGKYTMRSDNGFIMHAEITDIVIPSYNGVRYNINIHLTTPWIVESVADDSDTAFHKYLYCYVRTRQVDSNSTLYKNGLRSPVLINGSSVEETLPNIIMDPLLAEEISARTISEIAFTLGEQPNFPWTDAVKIDVSRYYMKLGYGLMNDTTTPYLSTDSAFLPSQTEFNQMAFRLGEPVLLHRDPLIEMDIVTGANGTSGSYVTARRLSKMKFVAFNRCIELDDIYLSKNLDISNNTRAVIVYAYLSPDRSSGLQIMVSGSLIKTLEYDLPLTIMIETIKTPGDVNANLRMGYEVLYAGVEATPLGSENTTNYGSSCLIVVDPSLSASESDFTDHSGISASYLWSSEGLNLLVNSDIAMINNDMSLFVGREQTAVGGLNSISCKKIYTEPLLLLMSAMNMIFSSTSTISCDIYNSFSCDYGFNYWGSSSVIFDFHGNTVDCNYLFSSLALNRSPVIKNLNLTGYLLQKAASSTAIYTAIQVDDSSFKFGCSNTTNPWKIRMKCKNCKITVDSISNHVGTASTDHGIWFINNIFYLPDGTNDCIVPYGVASDNIRNWMGNIAVKIGGSAAANKLYIYNADFSATIDISVDDYGNRIVDNKIYSTV